MLQINQTEYLTYLFHFLAVFQIRNITHFFKRDCFFFLQLNFHLVDTNWRQWYIRSCQLHHFFNIWISFRMTLIYHLYFFPSEIKHSWQFFWILEKGVYFFYCNWKIEYLAIHWLQKKKKPKFYYVVELKINNAQSTWFQ